jgi:hypothetical protein
MPCFIGGAILHFCYQKKPKKTTLIADKRQWIMLILFMHSAKWALSLMLPKMICCKFINWQLEEK